MKRIFLSDVARSISQHVVGPSSACVIAGLLCSLVLSAELAATSTGLNNIITADTPGHRELVFQSFTNFGDEREADYVAGFKMGLRPWGQHLEWGYDGRFGEGEADPAAFQFKYAFQPGEELPWVGLGAVNVAPRAKDRDEVGQPFEFVVLSHDFGWLRGHAGYGFGHDQDAAFFGFDKTVDFLGKDFMWRSDFQEIDDQDQWLGSVGFIYFMHESFALENWVSQPFEHGEPFLTIKLNLIIKF